MSDVDSTHRIQLKQPRTAATDFHMQKANLRSRGRQHLLFLFIRGQRSPFLRRAIKETVYQETFG